MFIILYILTLTLNIYSTDFSNKHLEVIKDIVWAANKAEIPKHILLAICYGESNFNTKKKLTHMDGKTLSYGICQVKLESAQWLDTYCKHEHKITVEKLENNKMNAFYAAKLLKYQFKRYNSNWDLAIDAYNKGTAISKKSKYVVRYKEHTRYLNGLIDKKLLK